MSGAPRNSHKEEQEEDGWRMEVEIWCRLAGDKAMPSPWYYHAQGLCVVFRPEQDSLMPRLLCKPSTARYLVV